MSAATAPKALEDTELASKAKPPATRPMRTRSRSGASTDRNGRNGRNGIPSSVTSATAARQHHLHAINCLDEGLGLVKEIVEQLKLDREDGDLTADISHLFGTSNNSTLSDALESMVVVLDERTKPSLEFVLGVLGVPEVPEPLLERQRNQGQRAVTQAIRHRAVQKRRDQQKAAKEAKAKATSAMKAALAAKEKAKKEEEARAKKMAAEREVGEKARIERDNREAGVSKAVECFTNESRAAKDLDSDEGKVVEEPKQEPGEQEKENVDEEMKDVEASATESAKEQKDEKAEGDEPTTEKDVIVEEQETVQKNKTKEDGANDSTNVIMAEPEPESKQESESKSPTEPVLEQHPQQKPEKEPAPEPEAEPQPEPEPGREAEPEPQSEPQPESDVKPQPETKPTPDPEQDPESTLVLAKTGKKASGSGKGKGKGKGKAKESKRSRSVSETESQKGKKEMATAAETSDEESVLSEEIRPSRTSAKAKVKTPRKRKPKTDDGAGPSRGTREMQDGNGGKGSEEEADAGKKGVDLSAYERTPREKRMSGRRSLLVESGDVGQRSGRLRRESSNLNHDDTETMLWQQSPYMGMCYRAWEAINQVAIAIPFREPVIARDAPGYYDMIKKPMDLRTIRQRIMNGALKTPVEFQRDLNLIVKNAKTYNAKDSDIYELASLFQSKCRTEVDPIVEAFKSHESGNNGDVPENVAEVQRLAKAGPRSSARYPSRRSTWKPSRDRSSSPEPPAPPPKKSKGRGGRKRAGTERGDVAESEEERPPPTGGKRCGSSSKGRGRGGRKSKGVDRSGAKEKERSKETSKKEGGRSAKRRVKAANADEEAAPEPSKRRRRNAGDH